MEENVIKMKDEGICPCCGMFMEFITTGDLGYDLKQFWYCYQCRNEYLMTTEDGNFF